MRKIFALLMALLIIFCVLPSGSRAGENIAGSEKTTWRNIVSDIVGHYPLSTDQANTNPGQKGKLGETKNWLFDFGLQRYIVSHTSYEIGSTAPPYQEPISRLEFPLDTWWLQFELRRTCPRWSVGGKSGLSVARNIDGRMKDTDWLRIESPETVTTYSEGALRAEQNYLFRGDVDVNIADWLGLPPSFEIRPLFAFEFQRFSMMDHDGIQWESGNYSMDLDGDGDDDDGHMKPIADSDVLDIQQLPGDTIHFRQDYYMYLVGLRGSCDLMKPCKYITVRLRGEADWGPALTYYEDHHLLREGDLFAYGKGQGNTLYFLAGLEMVLAKTVTIGIDMDYLSFRTTRATTWQINVPLHEDQSWRNGVKMWSDQTSLIAHVSCAF
ncbi:MAG: omptin family outer membrane protease [Candidatus Omnitrophica bacterium]|nr:omptin family outer membrane protease [Candidatus Omnitrophota bacterium]